MRRIRSRLTYANVMVTILAFIVLGGVSYAATGGNFILGQSNSASSTSSLSAPVAGKALQVTNTSTGAGASALGLNVASGHTPFTTNSGTKVANLNADKLDGIDSTGLVRGQGRILSFDVTDPSGGTAVILFTLPWLQVLSNCQGTSANGGTQVNNNTDTPLEVVSDNGGLDPVHHRVDARGGASLIDWDTNPSGEWLTFSFENSGKLATAFVFSYAFHNPVLNQDICHYQGQVIVNGPGS
jgi:hypothetical protein